MVSDDEDDYWDAIADNVLILVLMEYGLWRHGTFQGQRVDLVLILVLMEYGLWPGLHESSQGWFSCLNPCSNGIWSLTRVEIPWRAWDSVLILVLMEYGLWHQWSACWSVRSGLNPCSNGIWSLTRLDKVKPLLTYRLNPCSNGIWSLTGLWLTGDCSALGS